MTERTGGRRERAWHYHADGGWPYIRIGANGRPRAVSGGQLEHSHEGGNRPHTHRLIVKPYEPAPDDPHPNSGIHEPRFRAVRDDTPIYPAAGGSGRLRPHDWQPVRSLDRPEGLQLIERCAGCGAGQTTITAPNGEYRTIAVDPDPLPAGCTGQDGPDQLPGYVCHCLQDPCVCPESDTGGGGNQ